MRNPIRRVINFYTYNLKLQTKFLISHIVLIAIPTLVIAFLLYGRFYDIVVYNTISSEQAISEQTATTLNVTLEQIISASNNVTDNITNTTFYNTNRHQYIHNLTNSAQLANTYQNILSLIDRDIVSDIRVYYDEQYKILETVNNREGLIFQPISEITGTYWYGIFSTQEEDHLFCPELYLSPTETANYGELAYITRLPFNDEPEKTAMYVAVYFSQSRIDDTLKKNITVTDSATYIINSRDANVSTSDAVLSGTYNKISANDLETSIGTPGTFTTDMFTNDSAYIGYYKLAGTDWYMVSVIPEDNLLNKGSKLIYQFFILYIACLILAFMTALVLSRPITSRLTRVIKQMNKVTEGKPVAMTQEEATGDEIGILIDTYNFMTDEINKLLKQQEESAKALRLSEFKALQAQINPHFLYNTLDMINWLSLSDQKEELTKAVSTLSKFYKLTLSKRDTITPVCKELEHISLYVAIQNMRYDNAINLVVDIPPEIEDYKIPKLTFQPIVENAIQHGILMREDQAGDIVINGWREEEDIVFIISDNGIGIEESRMDKILEGENATQSHSNIGVYNTHLRLQLLYGNRYGLHYESIEGKGTEVTIRIPAEASV